jgi:hypothetical protein
LAPRSPLDFLPEFEGNFLNFGFAQPKIYANFCLEIKFFGLLSSRRVVVLNHHQKIFFSLSHTGESQRSTLEKRGGHPAVPRGAVSRGEALLREGRKITPLEGRVRKQHKKREGN